MWICELHPAFQKIHHDVFLQHNVVLSVCETESLGFSFISLVCVASGHATHSCFPISPYIMDTLMFIILILKYKVAKNGIAEVPQHLLKNNT